MSPRVAITLAIIAAVSVGIGACVFGILISTMGGPREKEATIIAIGATLVAAGLSALVARYFGGFRELEERED